MAKSRKRTTDFHIYRGDGKPCDVKTVDIPEAPPWRRFGQRVERRLGSTFVASTEVKDIVNAALHLRRPILITGDPGTGKSSVAYAVAHELGLGPVLKWPINSRTTLRDGLYQYDAIARLQDAQHEHLRSQTNRANGEEQGDTCFRPIGDYIVLGPLGTAMITSGARKPRVLLIDEIDKSDIDLPNDLLHVFEDGYFDIPELLRLAPDQRRSMEVLIEKEIDGSRRRTVKEGRVSCEEFPLVVLTSNGERELPPAFHRRCLRLDLRLPDDNADDRTSELHQFLVRVVERHLTTYKPHLQDVERLIEEFRRLRKNEQSTLAVDQLLQAAFLVRKGIRPDDDEVKRLTKTLLRDLRG